MLSKRRKPAFPLKKVVTPRISGDFVTSFVGRKASDDACQESGAVALSGAEKDLHRFGPILVLASFELL